MQIPICYLIVVITVVILFSGCATTEPQILSDHAVVNISGNEILLPKTAHRFEQVSNTELYFK